MDDIRNSDYYDYLVIGYFVAVWYFVSNYFKIRKFKKEIESLKEENKTLKEKIESLK